MRTWDLSNVSVSISLLRALGTEVRWRTRYCLKRSQFSRANSASEKPTTRRFHGKNGRSSQRARRLEVSVHSCWVIRNIEAYLKKSLNHDVEVMLEVCRPRTRELRTVSPTKA